MRGRISSIAVVALATLTLGAVPIQSAHAQEGEEGLGARTPAAGPACPVVEWRMSKLDPGKAGTMTGVAYNADMSGMSSVTVTVSADGKLTGTVKSVSGHGPEGTLTGTRDKAATHVVMSGAGCNNRTFNVVRWKPGSAVPAGGG